MTKHSWFFLEEISKAHELCICFLLLCNKLPLTQWLKTTPHVLSHSFHGSGIWGQCGWVLCSGFHKAEIKLGPGSHLRLQVLFHGRMVVGQIHSLAAEKLMAASSSGPAGESLSSSSLFFQGRPGTSFKGLT